MRARTTAVALLAGAGLAASAVAAIGSSAPKNLVLQKSDMPSSTKRITAKAASGSIKVPRTISGKAFSTAFTFKNGSRKEIVGSFAGVVNGGAADAHAGYAKLKRDALSGLGSAASKVTLPRLGNEQTSVGYFTASVGVAAVLVRKNRTVWYVGVTTTPGQTNRQGTAELLKYARKQQRRVGSG
jgi:hypothetical protein